MPSAIQVLVVDDAVVIRAILRDRLSEDPDIEVAEVAANGRIALRKIADKLPDLVVLDLDMPEMNGLEALREIRSSWPSLPVIMFSGQTGYEARATVEALELGATACLAKPTNFGPGGATQDVLREQLIPMIKMICRGEPLPRPAKVSRPRPQEDPPTQEAGAATAEPSAGARHVEIVAIGASTGGPNALTQVLGALPGDLPVPVVVVQHMPATFTRHFAERLDKHCALTVLEGEPGMRLQPGGVWIAPGDYHMVLERDGDEVRLQTNQGPPESSCRPAVDPLLRSVVELYGANTLSVILTGMGSDGLEGCKQVRAAGGRVLVQDEETSVVWGMPGYVSEAGLAHSELPLNQLGPSIARWCRRLPREIEAPQVPTEQTPARAEAEEPSAGGARRALVVDDSRAVRMFLTELLRDLGFEATEASNGVHALEQIGAGKPFELALVDWNMPEMDGIQLLERLRARTDLADLKVVMVTSETEPEFMQRALEAGADDYVMKPFCREDLVERLIQLGVLDR